MYILNLRCHCKWHLKGSTVATLLPHSKKVPGSNTPAVPGPFCVEFACSLRVCVGSRQALWFPPTIKDLYVRINSPVRAPDQKNWRWVLHCCCPLVCMCVCVCVCVYRMGQIQRIIFNLMNVSTEKCQ